MHPLRVAGFALALLIAAVSAQAASPDAPALHQGGDIAYRRALAPAASARKLNADTNVAVRTRRIANRIINGAPAVEAAAREQAWAVNVVTDPVPELVVYPGGRLLVHDALVTQPGAADDEIAAIVAHMIAHSLLGHDTSRIAASAGAAMTSPDPNRRALAVADAAVAVLPAARYTPEEIEAADRESVQLVARAGYDPRAAGSAWRRLRGGLIERVPVNDRRLAALDAEARAAVPLFEEVRARATIAAPVARPPAPGSRPAPR